MDDTSVIDKVRKLLAMAEGTANRNEAEAFSSKAAQLIAAHRIDPNRLRDERVGDLSVRTVTLGRGAYVRGRLSLLGVIAQAQGCKVVFEVRSHGTDGLVAGFASDLDATELLYQSLHAQAASQMASTRRATAAATQQWRRSFLFGYAQQVSELLRAATESVHDQAHPSTARVPALRSRERQVNDFVRQRFGRVTAARPATPAQAGGFHAGQQAARQADLGRARLTEQYALGRGA